MRPKKKPQNQPSSLTNRPAIVFNLRLGVLLDVEEGETNLRNGYARGLPLPRCEPLLSINAFEMNTCCAITPI